MHTQLGISNKGHAIKRLVVCNSRDLEPLDLLNDPALGCYQLFPEVKGKITQQKQLQPYIPNANILNISRFGLASRSGPTPWQEVMGNKEDREKKGLSSKLAKGDLDLATLFTDKTR